jgi:phosphoribosylglycinamide formyltransferase-1
MSEHAIPRVAILGSGEGITAGAYAKAIHDGVVKAEIGLVVASSTEAGIIQRSQDWNRHFGFDTETVVVNSEPGRRLSDGASYRIAELTRARSIDLVALLGYMTIVRGTLMEEYGYLPGVHTSLFQARMVNSHPGPLPETANTAGMKTSQRVLDLGLTVSRHSVHVVAPGIDTGPVIVAHDVPVKPGDTKETLNQRTQFIEKATIAYALDKFLREQQEYRS